MANIAEVAKIAGVSHTTVARVINHHPGVRPQTRDLVREAMRTLRYEPPPAEVRRGPKTKARAGVRTRNIAYLMIRLNQSVISAGNTPSGMSKVLARYGMNLIYVPMPDPAKLPDVISPYRIDGIIYQGEEPCGAALEIMKTLPVVRLMTRRDSHAVFDCVLPDNEYMGKRSADFFHEQHIRRAAWVCSDPAYCAFGKRIEAFSRECGALDIALDFCGKIDTDGAMAEFRRFLANSEQESLGIFILDAGSLMWICRECWQLPPERQRRIELLLGDPLPMKNDACLQETVSYFDICSDALDTAAVEKLLWRMRNPESEACATDTLIRPELHICKLN